MYGIERRNVHSCMKANLIVLVCLSVVLVIFFFGQWILPGQDTDADDDSGGPTTTSCSATGFHASYADNSSHRNAIATVPCIYICAQHGSNHAFQS